MRLSNKIVFSCFAILLGLSICTSEIMAQRGGGGGGGRGGQQRGGGGGTSSAQLLRIPAVKEALELTPDQEDDLSEMGGGFDRDKFRMAIEGLDGDERTAKIREMIAEMQEEQKSALEDILLPHQLERLEQISFQWALRNGGRGIDAIATALDLDDDQKDKLEEDIAAMTEELAKEMAERRKEKLDDVMKDNLTKAQLKKWENLTEDAFEFPSRQQRGGADRGGRGGGGTDRGGRGGGGTDRGGRGGGDRGGRGGGGGRGGDRGGESDF